MRRSAADTRSEFVRISRSGWSCDRLGASIEDMHEPAGPAAIPSLSDREIEVLLAWFAADSKTDTAKALYIAPCTVHTHITRVRAKYEAVGRPAQTKAALFARAIQDGLTSVDSW
ncbi:LuxR family transcriptional regulator [Rhodococcus kroppenstedtii]|nr:LuxR family transcriptional regulator [Rhodococcus kroppenstedtii]